MLQIKSIYETGKMPVSSLGGWREDNHALSYDEVQRKSENKNKDEERVRSSTLLFNKSREKNTIKSIVRKLKSLQIIDKR